MTIGILFGPWTIQLWMSVDFFVGTLAISIDPDRLGVSQPMLGIHFLRSLLRITTLASEVHENLLGSLIHWSFKILQIRPCTQPEKPPGRSSCRPARGPGGQGLPRGYQVLDLGVRVVEAFHGEYHPLWSHMDEDQTIMPSPGLWHYGTTEAGFMRTARRETHFLYPDRR